MAAKRRDEPVPRGPKGGKKHTPGRDHARKSQHSKRKRYRKKREREREEELERRREHWRVWDSLDAERKKLRPDLEPDCPRPDDEDPNAS